VGQQKCFFIIDMFVIKHCSLYIFTAFFTTFSHCGLAIRARAVQINMHLCMYLALLHICLNDGGRDIL